MKFTIDRSTLLRSLGHVQNVVERRNTIPILSNVKIEANSSELRLNATDMDIDVVETIPAEISSGGATTVSAHILYDIIFVGTLVLFFSYHIMLEVVVLVYIKHCNLIY